MTWIEVDGVISHGTVNPTGNFSQTVKINLANVTFVERAFERSAKENELGLRIYRIHLVDGTTVTLDEQFGGDVEIERIENHIDRLTIKCEEEAK